MNKITITKEELVNVVRSGSSYEEGFFALLKERGAPLGPKNELLPNYRYIRHNEINGDATIQWVLI